MAWTRVPAAFTKMSGAWLGFMILALCSTGCSLVYDFADECSSDDQCQQKRGGGYRCVQRYCVLSEASEDTVADQGDGGSETVADVPEIQLLKAPCDRLYGVATPEEALSPDTILLGALMPRSGQLAQLGPYLDMGIELAVSELNQNGGLAGSKFAVLSCDTGTDPLQAIEGAAHLVSVAKVPVILGAVSSGITIEVFNNVAKDAGVLMMSPVAAAPVISTIPDEGLLWRSCLKEGAN